MSVRFEEATAVRALGAGRYGAAFSKDWFVHAGPNGGIVAAVLLRACVAQVDDAARSPRTLTVHYLGPPGEGAATVEVTEERAGRGMTFLSARLVQDSNVGPQTRAVALVAFGAPRAERVAWSARPLPPMSPPDQCPDLAVDGEPEPPNIRHRWQCRWALGQAGASGPTEGTLTGGWLRPAEPTAVDHVLVAAMADAWLPPIIARPGIPPLSVPTVELTVHFRDTTTLGQLSAEDWFACSFRTDVAQEGFLEEDGLIWSSDGRLVAMSRQLAVVVDRKEFAR